MGRLLRWLHDSFTLINVIVTFLALFLGLLVSLVLLAFDETRNPVQIDSMSETDGSAVQGGRLNVRFSLIKSRECETITAHYLEQMVPDTAQPGSMIAIRFPINGPPIPLSRAFGTQKYILSLPMPSDIAPSDVLLNQAWTYQWKSLRKCGLWGNLFGGATYYSPAIPVQVITSAQLKSEGGVLQGGTVIRPDLRP